MIRTQNGDSNVIFRFQCYLEQPQKVCCLLRVSAIRRTNCLQQSKISVRKQILLVAQNRHLRFLSIYNIDRQVIASKSGSQWSKDIELSPSGLPRRGSSIQKLKDFAPLFRDAVIAHCSLSLRSAGFATLHSTARDHRGAFRIFFAKFAQPNAFAWIGAIRPSEKCRLVRILDGP